MERRLDRLDRLLRPAPAPAAELRRDLSALSDEELNELSGLAALAKSGPDGSIGLTPMQQARIEDLISKAPSDPS